MLGVGLGISSPVVLATAYPREANEKSLVVDGTNDVARQGDGDNIFDDLNTGSWSLQFYIYFPTSAASKYFMWKGLNFNEYLTFYTDSSGDLNFKGQSDSSTHTMTQVWDTSFAADTWYHVVITSDGSASDRVSKCYKDGSLVSATTASTIASSVALESSTGSAKFMIGTLLNLAFYSVNMDSIATWDAVLTAAEVAELSGEHPNLKEDAGDYSSKASLQRYYIMEEGTGTTVADSSGNDNAVIQFVNGATFSSEKPF